MADESYPCLEAGYALPGPEDLNFPKRHSTSEHSVMSSEEAPGTEPSSNRMPRTIASPNSESGEGKTD